MEIIDVLKNKTALTKFMEKPEIDHVIHHTLPSFQNTFACVSGLLLPVAMLIILIKKLK